MPPPVNISLLAAALAQQQLRRRLRAAAAGERCMRHWKQVGGPAGAKPAGGQGRCCELRSTLPAAGSNPAPAWPPALATHPE